MEPMSSAEEGGECNPVIQMCTWEGGTNQTLSSLEHHEYRQVLDLALFKADLG